MNTIAQRLAAAVTATAASTLTLGVVLALFNAPVYAEKVAAPSSVRVAIATRAEPAAQDLRTVYSEAGLFACSATGYCAQP